MRKAVPSPVLLSTLMLPPCASMIALLIARPSPVPPVITERLLSTRKNLSKMCGIASSEMPAPLSDTRMNALSSPRWTVSVISTPEGLC